MLVVKSAVCVECQETWDEETIGLLADHIRSEAETEVLPGANETPVGKPCPSTVRSLSDGGAGQKLMERTKTDPPPNTSSSHREDTDTRALSGCSWVNPAQPLRRV